MSVLTIVLSVFAVLETLNIILLYFSPGSRRGNAVGVFDAYEKARRDPEIRDFVGYLINWVAGTKLIFVALIVVIIVAGTEELQFYSAIALVVSVSSYYIGLHPKLRAIDRNGQLTPKGYSRTLGLMIGGFLAAFVIAVVAYLLSQ